MRLYRIIVLHAAPKDTHTSTETYLAAEDENRVADWIQENKCHGAWFNDKYRDESRIMWDDDNETEITFREWIMLKRGDLEDEEGWEDAYYGVTKWGWEEVVGATDSDITRLIELGIAESTN